MGSENHLQDRARLLISCDDRPGIVAEVTKFLFDAGGNIIESDQYSTDPAGGTFFMRVVFDRPNLKKVRKKLARDFEKVAGKFSMTWRISYAGERKKMAVFVSKTDHCLLELLWRWQAGDIRVDIPLVVGNHPDLRGTAETFGIPFYHVPVSKGEKADAEHRQLALLKEYEITFVVLARYMQILSSSFVTLYPNNLINIHHSFLPAFSGARPYERAYERGVKIIGATSHYVTDQLDEGPIIAQGVKEVNHRNHVDELKRIGRTIERDVLATAVSLHLEDRVIVHGNKTVVF
ncbi:MAG TPA: formyltetrahydrofolate deformylase [Bacillales bacterium]|jgi:formyltetrahydrofolate deformylase|nr:formyltetrahydrofolate deformylase [Bacillales bacterium]